MSCHKQGLYNIVREVFMTLYPVRAQLHLFMKRRRFVIFPFYPRESCFVVSPQRRRVDNKLPETEANTNYVTKRDIACAWDPKY